MVKVMRAELQAALARFCAECEAGELETETSFHDGNTVVRAFDPEEPELTIDLRRFAGVEPDLMPIEAAAWLDWLDQPQRSPECREYLQKHGMGIHVHTDASTGLYEVVVQPDYASGVGVIAKLRKDDLEGWERLLAQRELAPMYTAFLIHESTKEA